MLWFFFLSLGLKLQLLTGVRNIVFSFLLCLLGHGLFAVPVTDFRIPVTIQRDGYIVPFALQGGLIIIQAVINDSLGSFVVDTGAEGLVLNKKYFQGVTDESRSYYGVNGRGRGLTVSKNNNISAEGLSFTNIDADVVDLSSIENNKNIRIAGLIGFSLLKDFEVMFHYRERLLALSRVDETGRIIDPMPFVLDKVDSLTFVLGNFIPVIEVKVNGFTKKFGIDSGAEINLLDLKRSKNIMSEFLPMRTIRLAGANNEENEVIAGRLQRVKLLDKYNCGAMGTVLMNMDNLNNIYRTNLDGILGFEFLSPWLFSINYKKQMLYLHPLKVVVP
ncbi:MAG: aspartyl protease family protein [Saprospiraceae bacterium]|nr:aspartyl protease family protein [Saprospiraceae bacterium]